MDDSRCQKSIPLLPVPHLVGVEEQLAAVQSPVEAQDADECGDCYDDYCYHVNFSLCSGPWRASLLDQLVVTFPYHNQPDDPQDEESVRQRMVYKIPR